MYIESVGQLAAWLGGDGAPSPTCPKISAALICRIGDIARLVSESLDEHTGLIGTALLVWTLEEHARGSGSLSEFRASAARTSPRRIRALAALLRAMADGRGSAEIATGLMQARAAEADADHVLDTLNLTLAYAGRNCRRYAGYAKYLASVSELIATPTLTRHEVEADVSAICARDAPIDFYTATSATSTGRTLLVPHCHAEFAALGAGAIGQTSRGQASPGSAGITLRLMPAGRLLSGPPGGGDTVLATYDTNAVRENASDLWDHIAGQLFAEFSTADGGRPIDTIHATPPFGLILLTKYMLQRGLHPRETAVRSLLVTGAWIGPSTWQWLEETWCASLETTYSCSELVGSALACARKRGRYHFAANLLPEVLDDAGQPVAHGAQGRLHLTGLYPYQRSAIFLRYEVGDWGRWGLPESCDCGLRGPSFEMLGRTPDVLHLTSSDGTRWPIAPIPIRNALDRFDCVPKIPRPQYRLRIEGAAATTTLRIDVECYALGGADWQRRTQEAIAEAIMEEDESVGTLVAAHELEVKVALHARSRLTSGVRVR